MTLRNLFFSAMAGLVMAGSAVAEPQPLDRIAVLVNDGVVLESEITSRMANIKASAIKSGQALPSDAALRVQITDRLINESLQLQMAERMGMVISDIQLDQTLENMAREQNITLADLKAKVEADGENYAQYRESVRREIILGQVQRVQVQRRIQVSPQEIETLVKMIEDQGLKEAEFKIGHILIEVTNNDAKSVEKARGQAEKVLGLLEGGADFAKTAISASAGPKALEGGDWGWMNINAMPTLFAELVRSGKKGDIIGPVKSAAGFHIIKVEDTRGQQTQEVQELHSRHILLKPSPILSEDMAQKMLADWMAQVRSGDADFAELAKEHSDDPGSAIKGGDLGWADPSIYVPAFESALANLKPGEYSQPFRSTHGWHVVQLLERRTTDTTQQMNSDRAYQLIFRRKFNEQATAWQQEMRAKAYIEMVE
ncbi:peptidylprolyl isomerase SurA [Ferrimonas aestuarii]|uniref:Chaperone SurA n=2 Tax=Ferrimonas aestuarii TaxID=2569539 RepID=A0A4U1BJH6_9GAMM|nr:peptidylprolyl isomerase SurA [Ferrimonas aestuarii]